MALWELRHRDDYAAFRDALIEGYRQHRELPDEQLSDLDVFIAARGSRSAAYIASVEDVGEEVGGVTVGAGHGVGVDVDGGRGAGVAEPLGDHRDGDAGGEHGGGHEVAQVVQPEAGEPGSAPVGDEALRDPVRLPGPATGRVGAEHEAVGETARAGGRSVAVGGEQFDADGIEGDAVGAPVLGRSQHRSGRSLDQRSGEADGGVVEVDVGPAHGEELAAAGAGGHREVEVGEELDVLLADGVEEAADLLD